MAVKPLKDPRYRPIRVPGSTARRYVDTATGETITRAEFERRTAQKKATTSPTGPAPRPTTAQAAQAKAQVQPGDRSSGRTGQDTVVVAEAPSPPPILDAATKVGQEAAAVAAAARKSQDLLADKIGEGIALCISYMSQATLPDHLQYLALPDNALARVVRPVARITARHMPVQVNGLSADGEDMVDLFNGILFCVTAISSNKLLYQQQLRELQGHYEQLDTTGGRGDVAPAPAVPARAPASAGRKGGHAGPADHAENGAGSSAAHNGHGSEESPEDAAAKVGLIRELYSRDAERRRKRRGL